MLDHHSPCRKPNYWQCFTFENPPSKPSLHGGFLLLLDSVSNWFPGRVNFPRHNSAQASSSLHEESGGCAVQAAFAWVGFDFCAAHRRSIHGSWFHSTNESNVNNPTL